MEASTYLRFLASLTLVIGVIFAVAWAARRWGVGVLAPRPARGASGARRLALVDALPLDGKRRLVLVRRDDREHLLLLGMEGDLVVEQNCAPPRFELPSPQPEAGS
jgi:flagellar protein FliO/FliZ